MQELIRGWMGINELLELQLSGVKGGPYTAVIDSLTYYCGGRGLYDGVIIIDPCIPLDLAKRTDCKNSATDLITS